MKICIWPDQQWCFIEQLEEYTYKSDDYAIQEIPDSASDEDIEKFVEQYVEVGEF